MKLLKVTIADFRSILNQEIHFDEKCIGLIGLNESGKSNVLNAIRLLDHNYVVSVRDRSKISRRLPRIDCQFSLEQLEMEKLEAVVAAYKKDMTYSGTFELTVQFPETAIKSLQIKQAGSQFERAANLEIGIAVRLNAPVCKAKNLDSIPADVALEFTTGKISLREVGLAERSIIPAEYQDFFEDFDVELVETDLRTRMEAVLLPLAPQVIFWEFNDKYLLPSEIDYETFLTGNDPYNNSAPLFNIFLLSKALRINSPQDLREKIVQWKVDSSERRKDGAIVTKAINDYIKRIWTDYDQELKVELEESKITIHITDPSSADQNFYAMEARSQGFKTFISFILTIAAEAENGIINNFILLLDEPETHLHPSGVRYMREELLKLSSTGNYIVFSTHSVFMIDRQNLRRHVIVSKQNEITTLTKVTLNNFIQEAVIYEKMGTQLDEFSIGNKNILLEGDLDLLLLEFFMSLYAENDFNKNIFGAHLWNGGGTKRIGIFFKSKLLPHGSHWYVILDNDKPGQDMAKTLVEDSKASQFKVTATHYSQKSNAELEDILPKQDIQNAFDFAVQELKLTIAEPVNFENDDRVVSQITGGYQAKNKLSKEETNLFEQTFKDQLHTVIAGELQKLAQTADLETRRNAFVARFSQYHESVSKIMLKAPPKVDPEKV